MILDKKSLTLAEVGTYIKDLDEKPVLKEYLEKFTKLSSEKAVQLKKEVESLNNPKVNNENIIKIVDFLPKDSEDLNKILNEVSLTEEESNAILNITKNY